MAAFYFKLNSTDDNDITDEIMGTNTEAIVPAYVWSLYEHSTPPKKEDRPAEANGSNSPSNGSAASETQTQNTNGNNSHDNGFAASEQTQAQNTNGNNSHGNGLAATASEQMQTQQTHESEQTRALEQTHSNDQAQTLSCQKCRGNFTVDQLETHMPTCRGTQFSFGTR